MQSNRNQAGNTIRRRSTLGVRVLVCLLAFVATVPVVHSLRPTRPDRPVDVTAATTIRFEYGSLAAPTSADSIDLPRPEVVDMQQRLVADANLARAVREVSEPASSTTPQWNPAQAREHLQILASAPAGPDQWLLAVECSGENADWIVRFVNTLVEQCVADARVERADGPVPIDAELSRAIEQAWGEYVQAGEELDQVVRNYFQTGRSVAVEPGSVSRGTIPNPEWGELAERRTQMDQRREQLLLERTLAHPVVRDLTIQLNLLDEYLAGIPREIPAPDGVVSEPTTSSRLADLGEYNAGKGAVERAWSQYERLEAERRLAASRAPESGPRVVVQPAEPLRIEQTPDHPTRRLLIALAAGLAVAASVGMIATGFSVDPVLATTQQVQQSLGIPVVGMISTGPSLSPSEKSTGRGRSAGLGLVAYGVILLTICLGCLFLLFLGGY